LFTKAEMENRKDVICGGYLFAKKIFAKDRVKGEKQGFDYIYKYLDQYEGDQHKAALEYAKDLNADVNFIYSNADLPNMFKTVKGKLFLQFKTYPINYLATTMKWTLQKPNNVHYYTRLARLAGTTIVLGGARSLPYVGKGMFYGVLFGGLDDPPETSKAYKAGQFLQAAVLNPVVTALLPESSREYTRKVLARGIFATMGIDLSTRMGPNEFIPENWRQLGGPFVNDLVSFYEYSQGDISWKQFLRIVPAVRDINTALAANEYITDPNRRERNVVRVLGWERMLEGIGAPSTRRQVARDVQAMTAEMQRGYSENKANYIDDAIAQLRSIDQTQDLKAINKAESVVFNKVLAEAAEEGIYIAPTDILSEMDRKHDTVLLRAYDMAPIDLRPELEQKFEQVRKLYGIEMFY